MSYALYCDSGLVSVAIRSQGNGMSVYIYIHRYISVATERYPGSDGAHMGWGPLLVQCVASFVSTLSGIFGGQTYGLVWGLGLGLGSARLRVWVLRFGVYLDPKVCI